MLAFMGFLSGYSGYLLGIAARKTGLSSYEGIAVRTLGPKFGKGIALFSVIGVTFSAGIAYTSLFGDTGIPIISVISGANPVDLAKGSNSADLFSFRTGWLMFCTLCEFPMSIRRQMSGVSAASLISIISM